MSRHSTTHLLLCLVLAMPLCGCTPPASPATVIPSGLSLQPLHGVSFNLQEGDQAAPQPIHQPHDVRDPQPIVPELVSITVYQFSVPRGTVSGSDEFWKHVDEHQIDPFHYDVLQKNGIRAGVAPQSDWEYFRNILSRNPAVHQETGSAGTQTTAIDIPLKMGLLSQELIYSDGNGNLPGQAYDGCDDLMTLVFAPVYRHPGVVHVKLTPFVRARREKIEITATGTEIQYSFVHPEYLYDVNLDVDIPFNDFLLVAPSSEARNKTSIGHNFLEQDGHGQQFETLLLISPRPFRFDDPAPARPTTGPALAPVVSP